MRAIFSIIKTFLFLAAFSIFALLATIVITVTGLVMLVFGRRVGRFQIYTNRQPLGDMENLERPPMRDVTPRATTQIPNEVV